MPGTGSNKLTTQFQGSGNSKCGVASRIARRGIIASLLSRRANGIEPNSAPTPTTCIKQAVFSNYTQLVEGVKDWLNDNKECYVEINNWKITDVTQLDNLFNTDDSTLVPINTFNDNIGNWDTRNVTSMTAMFKGQKEFNQDIGSWNVRGVTDMIEIFRKATNFNQNIGSWNVSGVNDMLAMFNQATNFNQDIGSWNVSGVNNMREMFKDATKFNQDLSSWNVSGLTGANSWNTISGGVFAGSAMALYVDNSNLWPRVKEE